MENIGRLLLLLGLGLALTGAIIWGLSRTSLPLGRLPGDLQFNLGGASCFVPLASMILVSLLLTVVINVILRFLNR